jgi:hypothetical protein
MREDEVKKYIEERVLAHIHIIQDSIVAQNIETQNVYEEFEKLRKEVHRALCIYDISNIDVALLEKMHKIKDILEEDEY